MLKQEDNPTPAVPAVDESTQREEVPKTRVHLLIDIESNYFMDVFDRSLIFFR